MTSVPDRQAKITELRHAIRADYTATADTTGLNTPGRAVLTAIGNVPRDRFVPPSETSRAWENAALPIGHGQTISQPFIVALMTDLLALQPGARVLEIGTGCGYQTAILAELSDDVYSIEVIPELARKARERLDALGYTRVNTRTGDGCAGWPEAAPFDGIIVTAGAPRVPARLVEQLAAGGRLVIPVNTDRGAQTLMVGVKKESGKLETRWILAVRFVPLVDPDGGAG
ncbi:protein-L-isoaspartate(D-aspartate) O-methyltransferase [Ectothiorhodospira lacustris]|uniref:protein-L-isoaspartate(D-aspartate) O-methyltransferase n=1 Tax=Ectothiorhodospira lacustris TaxID=2899127 RepID=UPI001EE7CAD8|nr:protein-L-isoaspartate(D-aspartate) O-methyltransferase [Ectothiorhodospira lacustris]MCG5501244.1 protein-L-isoaspartate(D-aspartate) O-methyltransferase [Ectothiorhodospira lacustris]MCG5509482.1 protein-L-isoaspartate(D-aspartate) O-methyltransferase [Ectothiorhodospira lacustris]MCG5521536.1 protein-L-isoaspartate(D-aspartate) O-methyltransferase [Ectothiorhodospira lacustris]